ncbi:MAG: hypothetical protein EA409_06995 [Saprospirales bacterium]|nr:MAG: hypothetical protein EA409_06995 [Saprospirales bacterium]
MNLAIAQIRRIFCGSLLMLIGLALGGIFPEKMMAQQPGFGDVRANETENDTLSLPPVRQRVVEADTQFVHYFLFDQPFRKHDLLDDPYRNRALHFDLARGRPLEYATTGHLGGAAHPMLLEVPNEIGFRPGIEDYRLYWMKIEDQPYFRQHRAYSDLMYAQGSLQDENTTRAMFSTQFDDGVNLSLEYRRINHQGNYNRQRNFNTFISASLSHFSEDGKWYNFGTFLSNAVLAWENGGITTDTLFNVEFFEDDRSLIDVFSENAESRQQQRAVYLSNYRLLSKANIFGLELPLYLNHYMSFGNRFFRYSDNSPNPEYYKDFFQSFAGMRRFLEVATHEQRLGIAIGSIFNTESTRQKNYLTANLLWVSHRVRFDPESFRSRQWFVQASAGVSPGSFLSIEAEGALGLGDDSGDARLNARADFSIGRGPELYGELHFLRRAPSLIQNRFPSPEGYVFNSDLPRYTHSSIGGGLRWEHLFLDASFRQHLLFNLHYFNEDGKSDYLDETVAIPQLRVSFKPDLGPLVLHSHFFWQQQSRRELGIPSFYLKQRVAAMGQLFDQALDFQIGLEGLYFSGYEAKRYFPALGNFMLSDRRVESTFRAEPFLAVKIQTFEAVLRFENFGYIFTDRIDYQFDGYPLADFQWRLMLRWQLND